MADWVTLAELKTELKLGAQDLADDETLSRSLDAAVAYVQRRRPDLDYLTPAIPADVRLGTLRLAGRWHTRLRSPDGLVNLGELGSARVPRVDPDIEVLLGGTPAFSIRPQSPWAAVAP